MIQPDLRQETTFPISSSPIEGRLKGRKSFLTSIRHSPNLYDIYSLIAHYKVNVTIFFSRPHDRSITIKQRKLNSNDTLPLRRGRVRARGALAAAKRFDEAGSVCLPRRARAWRALRVGHLPVTTRDSKFRSSFNVHCREVRLDGLMRRRLIIRS